MQLLLAGILAVMTLQAQKIIPLEIFADSLQNSVASENLLQFGIHKQLPPGYTREVLEALSHFPELENVPVRFRIKKSFATLKTRPTFLSMFMPKGHRSYIITISNNTSTPLAPLLFMHLGTAARTGVIGHELSHVLSFSKKSDWQCFKTAIGHLSARYLDRLEYNTDMICIQHGLGRDLEAWSSYIRKTMHTAYWRGAGYVWKGDTKYERYMNPSSIEKQLQNGNSGASGGDK